MKRGCTQCGECLNVCPVYELFKREEYAPKAKRLLMEPLDDTYGGGEKDALSWDTIRDLARMCAGCGRCQRACARKLSTADLLADARAKKPHWTQALWDVWIRKAGPLWPLAGKIAMLAPEAMLPGNLRPLLETARALVDMPACSPWMVLGPHENVAGRPVVLFSGCTAKNVRPRWIEKTEKLLRVWGYDVLDAAGFTCCGGTLHHAGQYKAQENARNQNLDFWRSLGKPLVATFCASCKHSLDDYAAHLPEEEGKEWQKKCQGLSALLVKPRVQTSGQAPASIAYHQPCHWNTVDPDLPLLKLGLPGLTKGTGL
ncbi:MAG: (Fe-S)-binding protein, partial [Desulfovibrio sp.]|nr:(Fe-S)-binding protein [Desulfovibrio sp.]